MVASSSSRSSREVKGANYGPLHHQRVKGEMENSFGLIKACCCCCCCRRSYAIKRNASKKRPWPTQICEKLSLRQKERTSRAILRACRVVCYTVQSKYRNHSLHQANTYASVNWYQWSVLSSFQVWPPPHFAMWATSSLPFSFFLLLLSPYAYSHPGKSKLLPNIPISSSRPIKRRPREPSYREMLNSNLNCHLRAGG